MARPKGSPNRATAAARDAFNALVDGRLDDLNAWIDRVALDDPARAFGMVMTLASYCVPRPRPAEPDPVPLPPVVIRFTDAEDEPPVAVS
jgi:hypothetical protein